MREMLFALLPLYGLADRLWGASKPSFPGKRAAIALALVGAGFLAFGVSGALFGVLWVVYRALPFFGGSAAPETPSQRVNAVLRHLPALLGAVAIAYWRGPPVVHAALSFAAYVLAATGLACWYGAITLQHKKRGEPGGDENAAIELCRGAFFGLAIIGALA